MTNIPTFLPSTEDSKAAIPIASALQTKYSEREAVILLPGGKKQNIPLPLVRLLALASQAMTRGYAVSLTIHAGFLTTKEAADILACSRQHVVKLIEEKKLPAEKIPGGTHRRIKIEDLIAFMKNENIERENLMDELAAEVHEVGGYDEIYKWKKKKGSRK
ncbi:MAG: helix-turn-helix domain-containing protein [Candidatus Melainabacteria bacterium]|nr:MAG: helix-turn-helix domain-containing protein [Candidatus Melainabacteria bacterium]